MKFKKMSFTQHISVKLKMLVNRRRFMRIMIVKRKKQIV